MVEAQCEQFVSLEWGMRIAVAEERLPVFRALAKITADLPPDQRDQQILAAWKEKLMAECPEAEKWRPLYQMAAVRREVLKRLQASIDAQDDAGIVQWGSKHCLAKYPLRSADPGGDCRGAPSDKGTAKCCWRRWLRRPRPMASKRC